MKKSNFLSSLLSLVRGISDSRGVVQDDQLPGIHQCGGGGALRQGRSLGQVLAAAPLVSGGPVGYRAATATSQGLSAVAPAAGSSATGIEDQAGSLNEGCLTSTTREPERITTNFVLDSPQLYPIQNLLRNSG